MKKELQDIYELKKALKLLAKHNLHSKVRKDVEVLVAAKRKSLLHKGVKNGMDKIRR